VSGFPNEIRVESVKGLGECEANSARRGAMSAGDGDPSNVPVSLVWKNRILPQVP